MGESIILIPGEPLKTCFDNGHELYEDNLAWLIAKERVFYCKTCMKCFICIEDIKNRRLRVKKILPLPTTNEEIAKYLTFTSSQEVKV